MILKEFIVENKKIIAIALAVVLISALAMLWFFGMSPMAVLGISLSVLVILGLALYWFLNNLPDAFVARLFHRVTKASTERNANRFKEDGLYVITTGTGAPLPDKSRAGPQAVVVAGDQVLVFDAGPGSTHQLEMVIGASSVNALFMTHYHSDHIGDMGELMLKRWGTSGIIEPLPIYGPPGIDAVLAGFEAAYLLDKGYRVAHHGEEAMPPSGFGGTAHLFDLGEELTTRKIVYEKGDVQVLAFNVDHKPVFPAVGYKVTYKDRSVVISGDTIFTESLIEHARGADVLICEALNHKFSDMLADAGREMENNISTVAEDIQDYHLTPEQAGMLARDAEIPTLIITHVLPPVPTKILERSFLRDARAIYDGRITMANDGTMAKMPTGSDEIMISETLK